MRVVVDTNVWVSGSILPDSIPGEVLQAARARRFEVVASWELAGETASVLRRPKLRRYGISEAAVTDVLALLAPFLPTVEFDVAIRDVTDRPLVIAAVAGHADAIVTGDRDLLDDTALQAHLGAQGIRILSPRELLSLLPAVSEERGRYVTRRRRYRVAGPRTRMRRAAARAGLSR